MKSFLRVNEFVHRGDELPRSFVWFANYGESAVVGLHVGPKYGIIYGMKTNTLDRKGGYNCVVCIKQVPDTKKVTGEAMKADGTINRAALPAIFNPEDRNALEAALRVKDMYPGT